MVLILGLILKEELLCPEDETLSIRQAARRLMDPGEVFVDLRTAE